MVEQDLIELIKEFCNVKVSKIKYHNKNVLIGDDKLAFFLCDKKQNYNFTKMQIDLIHYDVDILYVVNVNFDEDMKVDFDIKLKNIKTIYFKNCTFKNNVIMENLSNIEIRFEYCNFTNAAFYSNSNLKNNNLFIYLERCEICHSLFLNVNEIKSFISKDLKVNSSAYFKADFTDDLMLQNTLFNDIVSFSGSNFKKIPDFSSAIFKDTKQVYFDYTSLEHNSKVALEEQVSKDIKNNYDKKDYENIIKDLEIKKQNANKLQITFRLLKDIAITQNNKIYAKEYEKLELFAYEIYLKAERDIKSKEFKIFLKDKNKFKQKRKDTAITMWKATLEHSLLKFYEITSEHHTNFARIINFTLAIVFSLYLELSIVKIFSFFNTGFFNYILTNFSSDDKLVVCIILLYFVICMFENTVYKFMCFVLIVISIALFIFPDYFVLTYFGILLVLFLLFSLKIDVIYYFISICTVICFICFPIFSKNIITSPSIYYLDDTLNKYTQEGIRNALKIASVENQENFNPTKKDSESKQEPKEESKPSQNEVSSNISINQAQEPYDLFFGTNIVNLSAKNAQNIQDIKQFIKDNKFLMYYTSIKSSDEIYNDIIKAIWIDLQLDTIYFIFFVIMILCIYSMQKTFRKNTI